MNTADLCDENADKLGIQLAKPIFKDYGGCAKFGGKIVTTKSFEDNLIIFQTLRQPGNKLVKSMSFVIYSKIIIQYCVGTQHVTCCFSSLGWFILKTFTTYS